MEVPAIVGLCVVLLLGLGAARTPPNIVIILADDLGWNDVSFHGSNQIPTPNIDALAYSGVILRNYYTQPICTPARAALLTARHPIHNGMEHDVIYAAQPWGLPLSERVMPQYLKSLGYVTRGVGKWHLGFFKSAYAPTKRGFDSFYGTWLGHGNHFSHMAGEDHPGYDLHRGLNASWEGKGRYAADLFTEESETIIHSHDVDKPLFLYLSHTAPHAPLQAPQETIDKFQHIPKGRRRTFAAMVSKVDESVGRVTQALKSRNMLDNSIILFLTDNGGATNGFNGNVASNWPLKGCKDTLFEGGLRGVGLIWSPLLKAVPRVHHGLVNVQDWLPTLMSAINPSHEKDIKDLDGVSQWAALNSQTTAPYKTMLHNIDPYRKIAALRQGKWKIIKGRTYDGRYDGWCKKETTDLSYNLDSIIDSPAGRAVGASSAPLPGPQAILALRAGATLKCHKNENEEHKTRACEPQNGPCLFNIEEDPCELRNVAESHPGVMRHLLEVLDTYHPVKPNNRRQDPRSFPSHWNNTWTTWMDFL